MATYRFVLTSGTVLETEAGQQSLIDEVAFERYFKCSSAVMAVAQQKASDWADEAKAAREAGEDPPEMPAEALPRTEWVTFFAWRRLRREQPTVTPAKFDVFIESVETLEFIPDPEEEEGDAGDGEQATAVDEGSGLDPTATAPLPTPSPSSSSPASVTRP
jgi:hypothetical protein